MQIGALRAARKCPPRIRDIIHIHFFCKRVNVTDVTGFVGKMVATLSSSCRTFKLDYVYFSAEWLEGESFRLAFIMACSYLMSVMTAM